MIKVLKVLDSIWRPLVITVSHKSYSVPFLHFLQNQPSTQCSKLSNGLTIATEERECYNASVGIYIDAGSRYENNFENGITHFFEHIAFKSTLARTKTILEDQISSTGARFKCFTTREMAAYYVECFCQDIPLVVDILSDCLFNNSFSTTDIEHQKKTVYAEMIDHDHNPNDVLYDYLHATAFQGTPLAQTVMGPTCNLYNFTETTITRYLGKCFDPARMVFAAVGGVKHDQMVALASTYLTRLDPLKCIDPDVYRYTGSEVRFRDDSLPVASCAIAVEGPCICDDDQVIMEVAAAIVSGWDRSQPGGVDHSTTIARAVSVEHMCDSYKAFNINYKDTGLWGVQFMARSLDLDDTLLTIQREWMHMCNSITDGEVERAKRELKTRVLSKTESATSTCHDIGRWVLYNGSMAPLHERICAIDGVFAKHIREVCTKYLYDRCPVVAAVGPTEGLFDYTRIRAGMYWLRV